MERQACRFNKCQGVMVNYNRAYYEKYNNAFDSLAH